MTPNPNTVRMLASQLPGRINAARHSGIDCIRLTLAEAQAVKAILPREVVDLDAKIRAERKAAKTR